MTVAESPTRTSGPQPILDGTRGIAQQIGVYVFVVVPLLALIVADPVRLGLGPRVGRRRHRGRVLRGQRAGHHRRLPPLLHPRLVQGRAPAARSRWRSRAAWRCRARSIDWVADHRRHHAFSDKEGDPHSPWLFGTGPVALARGFWHSHTGWLFSRDQTNEKRFTPDLLADRDVMRVNRSFVLLSAATLLVPALLGGLLTWSWWGALTAFFWAGLVRVALLHHVTWSINSICHMIGDAPVRRARPLAQRLAAGGPVLRRVVAQPAPRRPHLRPPRRAARPGRHLRAGDPGVREARLGHLGALADAAAAGAPRRQVAEGAGELRP